MLPTGQPLPAQPPWEPHEPDHDGVREHPECDIGLDLYFFLAAILAVPVFGIADVLRMSEDDFAATGRNRSTWIVAQILLPVIGTLAYYAFVRPRVRAERRFGGE